MALFRADKAYHFSTDGTNPWAKFERVEDSDPAVYEFETTDAKAISRLKKVDGVELVETPKVAGKAANKGDGSDGDKGGDGGGDPADQGGADGGTGDDGSGGGASA